MLGASFFARQATIPAMQQAPLVRLAARWFDKAAEAAKAAGIPRA